MANRQILGIDCGGTKVMGQLASIHPETGFASPIQECIEVQYADHPNWNFDFEPISIDIQQKECAQNTIQLTEAEKAQGECIIQTIKSVITQFEFDAIGLCFPGTKTNIGVTIMVNGPRIPIFLDHFSELNSFYHDSDACVWGEWKSTIGTMQNVKNAIYIGGGTGIADGVILINQLIDLEKEISLTPSWDFILSSGDTVESCLSPKGMVQAWNQNNPDKIKTLDELSQKKEAHILFEKAQNAFTALIQNRLQFFENNHASIETIVIGQRLGTFLSTTGIELKQMIFSSTKIPITFSADRRLAALGTAWKKSVSN
ncbi:MAG: hypothetical protein HN657_07585 [Candidatus Marinimicrobia bacterium]|jgi:hypothetical protein|nr:hypothetical protein [Candidatus Neomarinimicrobiota bacterium]MBT3496099.1 hypothetical protein [Candidatus Neomarinimicrobiota bacterium]MBT3691884.1 hypothetical protein [Candidatus Neomarinimicrobiota bacterium]MBT3732400.1 hypothetical protein [Candidatus Neomarinimicrobiota bacterium]MBT4145236.1 hypothetical protein [Candidatus Neomarinimicrobiota bacterium]